MLRRAESRHDVASSLTLAGSGAGTRADRSKPRGGRRWSPKDCRSAAPTTIEAVALAGGDRKRGIRQRFSTASSAAARWSPRTSSSAPPIACHDVLDSRPQTATSTTRPLTRSSPAARRSPRHRGGEIEVVDIVVPVDSAVGPFLESARTSPPSGPDLYNPGTSEWDDGLPQARLGLDLGGDQDRWPGGDGSLGAGEDRMGHRVGEPAPRAASGMTSPMT